MKKIFAIILLSSLGCLAYAQQPDKLFDNLNSDSLNIGYEISVPKATSTFATSGVKAEVFENAPHTDIVKALYGKIAGLNIQQGWGGTSAYNFASMSLHGHAPLFLVDGFPRDAKDLLTIEIESLTVLKDAVASALYGVRGANGVVLVTTKRGKEGKLNISANYQFGVNTQFRKPEFADAYTYGRYLNQALGNDGLTERYNQDDLDAFKSGAYPNEFPNVDWWNEAFNNTGISHRMDLTVTGGNQKFKYFTAIEYYHDKAMLKQNNGDDRYTSEPTDTRLNLRANIDVDITDYTHMKLGLFGKLQEINNANCGDIYSAIYNTPAAAFPIKHKNGIYGGSDVWKNNPVGMLKDQGNYQTTGGTLLADLNLTQDLDMVTPGLKASASVAFDNSGSMYDASSKQYRYMDIGGKFKDAVLTTNPIIYGKDSETLSHPSGFSGLYMRTSLQAKLAYERLFANAHRVSSAVIYDQQTLTINGRGNSQKRQSIMATATYNYKDRYIVNGAFNYSGSAVLPPNDRFRSYPAISAAWMASNEEFLTNVDFLDFLKVHASYGLSGWDGSIPHEMFLQSFGGSDAYGYYFGDGTTWFGGATESILRTENLTVEKSRKVTFGIDMQAFGNRLTFSGDFFQEKRSDILVSADNTISSIIGINMKSQNAGVYEYRGVDLSLGWQDKAGNFSYAITGNLSYLDSKIINENQAFEEYDYLYRMGNRIGQSYGLETLGFFKDETEIESSPVQTFSEVRPGDVKYKDQNDDKRIDNKDVVKMFDTDSPRLYFGLNLKFSYKNLELLADLQGRSGVTVNLLNSPLYMPLMNNGNISQTFLNEEISWTPGSTNATMPRLTSQSNANNYRSSSLWYRNGSYLKLRNLQISYTIPKSKLRLADLKVFVQGTDLFSIDNIGFADPEKLHANYPSVRSYWAGMKFNF